MDYIKNKDSISVLLSSYNGEKYIKALIESILNQICDCNIQLIIRDDGSDDYTIGIITKLMEKYSNIILYRGRNIGVNASFFELIKMAPKSDYYAIADQDDIWLDGKINTAIAILKSNPNLMLYGSASTQVDADLNLIKKERIVSRDITLYNTMIQNFIGGHTQVFTHKFIEIIRQKYDISKIYAYDAYFTNVAMIYDSLYYDKNSYVYYRLHSDNTVGTGTDFFDWIRKNIKRIESGQGHLYSVQFDYISREYKELMNLDVQKEITRFQKARNSFFKRFIYLFEMKFYRQSIIETVVFKMLYLFGGWK